MEIEISDIRNGRVPWTKIKRRPKFKIENWDMRTNYILTEELDNRYNHFIVLANFGRVTPGATMEDAKKIFEIKRYRVNESDDGVDLNLLERNTKRTERKSRERLYQLLREMRKKNLTGFNSSKR